VASQIQATHETNGNGAASENGVAIEARGLRKSFGAQTVLNGIDLTIAAGESMVVLGQSGTGKSVLLKLIIGLLKPDAGSIRIAGREIAGLPMKPLNEIRMKMGFLFQDGALYDSLTVEENVGFPLRRHEKLSASEQKSRVRDLLARVGMEEQGSKMPAEISGGMKKRVGLARALALQPNILLFDEPTAGLDPITAGEIEELILGLNEDHEHASVVVTHDLHGAKTISDRVALLHEGNIVLQGTFKDLHESKDPFVSRFMKQG
jgi:phospholipid/cholesterol/gamma-HCH transport system ATP-binding protein